MSKHKFSNPAFRQEVLLKTNGKCAYCGCHLEDKFCLDHIEPRRRYKYHKINQIVTERGSDKIENLFACCQPCNSSKSDLSLDDFKLRITDRLYRLNNNSGEYNIAKRFGLIIEQNKPIIFYFETLNKNG